MALGLSSRKNLCIHPQVAGERSFTACRILPVFCSARISSYSWFLLSYVAVCFLFVSSVSACASNPHSLLYHMTYIDLFVLQERVHLRVWMLAAAG
jgi:hypothetical protein